MGTFPTPHRRHHEPETLSPASSRREIEAQHATAGVAGDREPLVLADDATRQRIVADKPGELLERV